jgi:hypothetical protein
LKAEKKHKVKDYDNKHIFKSSNHSLNATKSTKKKEPKKKVEPVKAKKDKKAQPITGET